MAKIGKKPSADDGQFAYVAGLTPVEKHGEIWLKRDDLYRAAGAPGGKARTCWTLAQGAKGLVAASHRQSPQMSMVARVAAALSIPCRIHTATGAFTSQMDDAKAHGAKFVQHAPGYNGVIIARARVDVEKRVGWREIPFGMESQAAVDLTAAQTANVPKGVKRIVLAVGIGISMSGILRGLDLNKLGHIPVLAIAVGTPKPQKFINRWAPAMWQDRVDLRFAEEPYSKHVHADVDGVVLDPVYEAKCVKFLEPGDLLWVVGIRASSLS